MTHRGPFQPPPFCDSVIKPRLCNSTSVKAKNRSREDGRRGRSGSCSRPAPCPEAAGVSSAFAII